jgi:hypothetical protein
VIGCCLVSLLILLCLGWLAIGLGVLSLGLVAGLSVHEAHHLVAAGLAGPDLQLGRPAGLRRPPIT